MAVINTGLLTKGVRSEFFQRYESTPTLYQSLSTRVSSNSDREDYRWLGSLPRMREWGTGRMAKGLHSESYSVENLKYESTIEVDRDEIADDRTGQIRLRIAEMAERAATHKDFLVSQLLTNGDQAGFHSYDGVPFFSSAHESGESGVQSNLLETDATEPSDPTSEEFRLSMRTAITALLGFRDDQGEPMSLTAAGLTCLVPTGMYLTALETVNSTLVGSSSNVLEGAAHVVALPWITDPTAWFLMKTDVAVRALIYQEREPVEFSSLTEESEEGFRREKFLYGVRARYRMTYGYWQFAVRGGFVVPG